VPELLDSNPGPETWTLHTTWWWFHSHILMAQNYITVSFIVATSTMQCSSCLIPSLGIRLLFIVMNYIAWKETSSALMGTLLNLRIHYPLAAPITSQQLYKGLKC